MTTSVIFTISKQLFQLIHNIVQWQLQFYVQALHKNRANTGLVHRAEEAKCYKWKDQKVAVIHGTQQPRPSIHSSMPLQLYVTALCQLCIWTQG